jgi:hypothetical protein
MIVPQFWAEGRVQHREHGARPRQVTIRRFGWSDTSQDDAQAVADARAAEALATVLAGAKNLPRREPKIPYNGAAGVPIREQIVARHGPDVITRNSYGARCLNTPDVLFADIDFPEEPSIRLRLWLFAAAIVAGIAAGWTLGSKGLGLGVAIVLLLFSGAIARALFRMSLAAGGGAENAARTRIARFVARHPDWRLRVYRTPAGFRVIAVHRPFAPDEADVAECFAALHTDPVYVAMCRNQQCFRARLSAKPWRIGIADHLRPRPGVWPVAPERMPERDAWIADYERKAAAYAACAFVEELGGGAPHPRPQQVVALHDAECSAHELRPLA